MNILRKKNRISSPVRSGTSVRSMDSFKTLSCTSDSIYYSTENIPFTIDSESSPVTAECDVQTEPCNQTFSKPCSSLWEIVRRYSNHPQTVFLGFLLGKQKHFYEFIFILLHNILHLEIGE